MKLGIFTDSHYSSQELTCGNRQNNKSLEKIKEAYDFFACENCDLIICLGDLIDKENSHQMEISNLKEVSDVINSSLIKTICVMGNHDGFAFTKKEFYEILKNCEPTDIHMDGKNLIFLDTCYFKNGNHYAPGDSDWTDTYYPYIEELEQKLSACSGDVYLFLHQNLDTNLDKDYQVYNALEINTLLHQSKKVKAVFQGHYHDGMKSIHNGIEYRSFPAVCENENAYFTVEL